MIHSLRLSFTLLFLSLFSFVSAQQIVVTSDGGMPLKDAMIISGPDTVITDASGKADISSFKGDSINVFIQGYEELMSDIQTLKANSFIISLRRKSIPLNEVVISASRMEENQSEIPNKAVVTDTEEIARLNPITSADLVEKTGEVYVQRSQQGGGSPALRGFEANKVLLVVDGVRMNNAIYRAGHLQNIITIDPSMVDRVETVYGPGSVPFGTDAFGGLIHFITKKPALNVSGSNYTASANAFARYASAADAVSVHADVNLGWKKFAMLTSVTRSDIGDLRQGANRNPFYEDWGKRTFVVERINGVDSVISNPDVNVQKPSGFRQTDILQKFLFAPSERNEHLLNIQLSTTSDIPRYDRLALTRNGLPRFAEWYYGPQDRLLVSYSYRHNGNHHLADKIRIMPSYQRVQESRHDRAFRDSGLNSRTETVSIYSLSADAEISKGKHFLKYGADVYYQDIQSEASSLNIETGMVSPLDTRYPDGGSSFFTAAVFVTHRVQVSKPFSIHSGIRASFDRLEAKFIDRTFFPFPFSGITQNHISFSGKLGAVYKPGITSLYTNFSTGFRAPNVDDLSKVFESVPGSVIVPNPELDPEYIYSAELGLRTEGKVRFNLNGFYSFIQNAIVTAPGTLSGFDSVFYSNQLSAVLTNTNEGKTFVTGFSASVDARLNKHLTLFSSVTYTYGRIDTDSSLYPLDHIPPVYGKTGLEYMCERFVAGSYVLYNGWKHLRDYNMVGEDNIANATEHGTPAWTTLNFHSSYRLTRNFTLQAAVENILDVNYRPFASGISAPGRNFVVTIRFKN